MKPGSFADRTLEIDSAERSLAPVLSSDKGAVYWTSGFHLDMDTRRAVLLLVVVVTAVMITRSVVAIQNGEFGTVGRQFAVGVIVLGFGVALVQHWEQV